MSCRCCWCCKLRKEFSWLYFNTMIIWKIQPHLKPSIYQFNGSTYVCMCNKSRSYS